MVVVYDALFGIMFIVMMLSGEIDEYILSIINNCNNGIVGKILSKRKIWFKGCHDI